MLLNKGITNKKNIYSKTQGTLRKIKDRLEKWVIFLDTKDHWSLGKSKDQPQLPLLNLEVRIYSCGYYYSFTSSTNSMSTIRQIGKYKQPYTAI